MNTRKKEFIKLVNMFLNGSYQAAYARHRLENYRVDIKKDGM